MKERNREWLMKEDLRWLDDPEVFRAGKLPAHSDHVFYRSVEEMEAGEHSLEQSLNGTWKFRYSKNGGFLRERLRCFRVW